MESDQSAPADRSGPDGKSFWRAGAVVLLKTLHTLIFFVESLCVFYMLYAAAANRVNRWTAVAAGVITMEGIVLLLNDKQCPLRVLTERVGAERGSVTDLFLPRWLADRIFQIYTPLFVVGCLGVAGRLMRKRQQLSRF